MNKLQTFLATTLPKSNYHSEQPLFVITTSDDLFEAVRAEVAVQCRAFHQAGVSDEDLEEHEYENVRVIRINPNDDITPRGHTGIGCIVQKGLEPTDACLRLLTLTLTTYFHKDVRQGFLELEADYGQS